jgi:hypothetical protein
MAQKADARGERAERQGVSAARFQQSRRSLLVGDKLWTVLHALRRLILPRAGKVFKERDIASDVADAIVVRFHW